MQYDKEEIREIKEQRLDCYKFYSILYIHTLPNNVLVRFIMAERQN